MRYKHTVKLIFEVETSDPKEASHSELAAALNQLRLNGHLPDEVEYLGTEEVHTHTECKFKEPIRFQGHRIAHSIVVPVPLDISHCNNHLQLNFYNEGTDRIYHKTIKRKLHLKKHNKRQRLKTLEFKYEGSVFTFEISEDDVLERQKFTFSE
jgi:hypothetical protein